MMEFIYINGHCKDQKYHKKMKAIFLSISTDIKIDMKDKRLIALKAYDSKVKECINALPLCSNVQDIITSFLEEYVIYEIPNALQDDKDEFESFERLNCMNYENNNCYACIIGECEKHIKELISHDTEVFLGIIWTLKQLN